MGWGYWRMMCRISSNGPWLVNDASAPMSRAVRRLALIESWITSIGGLSRPLATRHSRSEEEDHVEAEGELAAAGVVAVGRAELGPVVADLGADPDVILGLVDCPQGHLVIGVAGPGPVTGGVP